MKFGVAGVVELHPRFAYEGLWTFGEERGFARHEAVGAWEGKGDFRGLNEGCVGGTGIFGVGIGSVVNALVFVGWDPLGYEGDEHVVGRERIQEATVSSFIGSTPGICGAFGDLKRVEEGLVGELRGEGRAFTAVVVGLVERGDARTIAIEIARERRGSEMGKIGHGGSEHPSMFSLAIRSECHGEQE